ncbi:hypothetical protein OCU04_010324 [Sclerotinia nivalis]|uniref:Zn(2)-C6 fungal-type domain-containing protein n=1 Tax=Sclerotinia nivalis TaxID=352851 RepID=A0A9X0AEF7_9HELO|nr:hypothetical protein OCU04_010324 [Sclerotinia nivalis]
MKCDEGKSVCQRCLQAKQICERYAPPLSASASESGLLKFVVCSASTAADTQNLLPDITARQQRCFAFFRLRTAMELAGLSGADLRSSILLQTAHVESAILNAVVALGALYESVGRSKDAPASDPNYNLIHYQKATQK